MANFDLMGLMSQASRESAGKAPKYELRKLMLQELYPNPDNQLVYEVKDIEELADAIEIAGGVLHNLVVAPADEDGRHMIISGERRYRACCLLVERGECQYNEVNCIIENERDKDLLALMLLLTNSTARQLSDAEKVRQAEHLTAVLKRMQEAGRVEGRIRDIASKMLSTSSGQLARYHAIAENLQNPELKQAFHEGRMGISAAYEASRLDAAEQQKVAATLGKEGKVSLQHVAKAAKPEEEKPKTAYRSINPKHHEKLVKKMEMVGIENMTPCEQCKIATECQNCCRFCENSCNVHQECRKEQVSVAAILLAELEGLRQRHEKLAAKYGGETWSKTLAEKQRQAARAIVQLMDLVKEEQA
jgi:ParB-like chromosome segregation protein Spo0J